MKHKVCSCFEQTCYIFVVQLIPVDVFPELLAHLCAQNAVI